MKLLGFLLAALLITTAGASARESNNLLGARSPYLLQHLYNPVDWHQWGPEALEKARAENKLIFVSVGYSSCHWCHVMEQESFEDEAIAALLNAHFVSIKIDRESRPDLDEQFMMVTQLLTGSGGWPNSVFLTPDGEPFHAGGYYPPDAFHNVVFQASEIWQHEPAFVAREAAKIAGMVSEVLTRSAEALEIGANDLHLAATGILAAMDPFAGGYGVAPKFPREAMFLFLLDQAQRAGDEDLLQAVTDALDGMIAGGIHDHVGGGFHRYSVDPDWHVPHFEKMLYNQALTGRLLLRAWGATGRPRYRRAAERLFDYVLRDLRDPAGGFYSAQDADSLDAGGDSVEGAYYTWTPEALAPLGAQAGLVRDAFQISDEGDLDGANVLNLWALPGELAEEAGVDRAGFVAELDTVLARMRVLREAREAPFLDRKVLVSWNAAMIETLAEAAYLLERPDYYTAAETAARFILDRMRDGVDLKRVSYEGGARIAAQLPDYAGLGLALVALHDYAPDRAAAAGWLRQARGLADGVRTRFGPVDTGYRMTETRDGLSEVIAVDDGEIPSGNALALALFARLTDRMQATEIALDGLRLAAALSGRVIDRPEQRGFALKAIAELQDGQTGPLRHAAKGAVRVELHHDRASGDIVVAIMLADGWHINAHQPLEEYFIATELVVEDSLGLAVHYPEPVVKALSFNETPLALYEGELRLVAKSGAGTESRRVRLVLQACSDEICLQPEELRFMLW